VNRKPESPKGAEQSQTADNQGKRIPAMFYRTEAGGEPVPGMAEETITRGSEAYWRRY